MFFQVSRFRRKKERKKKKVGGRGRGRKPEIKYDDYGTLLTNDVRMDLHCSSQNAKQKDQIIINKKPRDRLLKVLSSTIPELS